MHPAATTLPPFSAASRRVAMESCLAASMNPQVLTTVTSAGASPSTSSQPSADRRPASSSESTSLRAQPKVTSETVRRDDMASKRVGELRVVRVASVRTHGIHVRDRGRCLGGVARNLPHYLDFLPFFQGGLFDRYLHVCGPCAPFVHTRAANEWVTVPDRARHPQVLCTVSPGSRPIRR